MEENKTGFCEWVKSHKKQLIIAAGAIAVVIVGGAIIHNNKDLLGDMVKVFEKNVDKLPKTENAVAPVAQLAIVECDVLAEPRKYTTPQEPVAVCGHVRRLAEGMSHSAEKAAQAAAQGIDLQPNETWVDPYMKYAA